MYVDKDSQGILVRRVMPSPRSSSGLTLLMEGSSFSQSDPHRPFVNAPDLYVVVVYSLCAAEGMHQLLPTEWGSKHGQLEALMMKIMPFGALPMLSYAM